MKFDEFLFSHIGEMGRYQKVQFFLVSLPTIFTAMHALSWTFAAVQVPYRCRLPNESKYSEYWVNTTVIAATGQCMRGNIEVEQTEAGKPDVRCKFAQCEFKNSSRCTQHVFDTTEVKQTAIGRWDIVCERAYIKAVVQAFYYGGQMAGSMIFGVLGDRIGRKRVFFIAIAIQLLCGLFMSIAPTWWMYALLRAGTGFSHPGIFVIAVVIGMELVGPSYRKLAGVLSGLFFAFGQIILGVTAYYITDYSLLHVAIASPAFIFISYWWLVPESARWLVSQKKYEEADTVLQKAARMNGVALPDQWWQLLDEEMVEMTVDKKSAPEEAKKYSLLDLFKTPELRKRTIAVFYLWPVVSMVYYGISMKSDVFGGSLYVNFIAGGFIEMPALFMVYLLIDRVGRKYFLAAGYGIAGICLISNLFLKDTASKAIAVAQLLVTKGAITSVYAGVYTFTPELFPTVVRNSAMGCCSTIARVGAIAASFIAMWIVESFGKVFMIVPFAVLALGASLVTLFLLPETMGKGLPESIDQVERGDQAAALTEMETLNDQPGNDNTD